MARRGRRTRPGRSRRSSTRSTSAAAPRPGSIPARSAELLDGHRGATGRSPRRRDHARGEPRRRDAGGGRGLARRRRQPRLARRAVVRRPPCSHGCTATHTAAAGPAAVSDRCARRGSRTSRSTSSSGCRPRCDRDWARDLDQALRARARPPLALRAHRRGAHAARPLDRAGRGHAGGRGAVRGGVSAGAPARSPPRATSTTRCRTRPARASGPAQQRATGAGAPYLGLGPSAHSGFGGERRWNVREWAAYERAIAEGRERGRRPGGRWTQRQRRLEELYLGLRTSEGARRRPGAGGRARDGWVAQRLGRRESSGRLRLTAGGVAPARRAGGWQSD